MFTSQVYPDEIQSVSMILHLFADSITTFYVSHQLSTYQFNHHDMMIESHQISINLHFLFSLPISPWHVVLRFVNLTLVPRPSAMDAFPVQKTFWLPGAVLGNEVNNWLVGTLYIYIHILNEHIMVYIFIHLYIYTHTCVCVFRFLLIRVCPAYTYIHVLIYCNCRTEYGLVLWAVNGLMISGRWISVEWVEYLGWEPATVKPIKNW